MLKSFALVMALAGSATAANLPPGFVETRVAGGLSAVTAMSVAPDGRVFVSEQAGRLRVIKDGALLAQPALTLMVDARNERGLLGTALDGSGHLFAYYTALLPVPHNRVSRFTLNGDVAGSESTLIELPALGLAQIHNGGALHLGADGKLYVSVGENFFGPNAQSLDTTLGKLLRIDLDGGIPADNPFFDGATGDNRAIWAYGLRNPYTFDVQPGTGRIFVNDVGDKLFDEIDEIEKGGNYGWPETEGPHHDPRFVRPFYAQAWNTGDCTLIGAAFYNPVVRNFPASFEGKYFFADYCGGYIKALDVSSGKAEVFATGLKAPVDLDVSPDGKLYYLNRATGEVFAIAHAHAPPVASVQPAEQLVSVGEMATFTCVARGTAPLAFRWQRDGVDVGVGAELSFVASAGARVRCLVSDEFGSASDEAVLDVTADHTPRARIVFPAEGSSYTAGTTLAFAGEADDDEDGVLPPGALSWEVRSGGVPRLVLAGVSGGGYDVTGDSSPLEIILRARDSAGLVRVVHRVVPPVLTSVSVEGKHRRVVLDGQPRITPFSFDGVVGSRHLLGAASMQQAAEASPFWFLFEGWSDGGADTHVITLPPEPITYRARWRRVDTPPCITFPALSRFLNMPIAAQTGNFVAEFDVTATGFPISGNVGLSHGAQGGLPGQAALVTFGSENDGAVTVRDGAVSRADVRFLIQPGAAYHLRLAVNVPDHLYSVWITPPGGAEVALARDYGFRTEQSAVDRLDNRGTYVAVNPAGNTLQVCHFWSAASE